MEISDAPIWFVFAGNQATVSDAQGHTGLPPELIFPSIHPVAIVSPMTEADTLISSGSLMLLGKNL